MAEPKRPGRKTKEEETRSYLISLGIDPGQLMKGVAEKGSIEVPDPERMLQEFTEALYTQMKYGELKSTALVNGLKAVATLAEAAKPETQAASGPERGIDEIITDAGLPLDRRIEIGRQELGRLHARAAALELVVKGIEGEHGGSN